MALHHDMIFYSGGCDVTLSDYPQCTLFIRRKTSTLNIGENNCYVLSLYAYVMLQYYLHRYLHLLCHKCTLFVTKRCQE